MPRTMYYPEFDKDKARSHANFYAYVWVGTTECNCGRSICYGGYDEFGTLIAKFVICDNCYESAPVQLQGV